MEAPVSDALVFFGITGDLAFKKIFPALQAMVRHRGEREAAFVDVIGVASAKWTLESVKARMRDSLELSEARRELETQHRAEREDMVGIAAAIGVVAARGDLALMIEQRIQHVQRLARRRRDQLGEERPVAVPVGTISIRSR